MAIGKPRSDRQALIDDKAVFLKTLLNHYPKLFREWFEKEEEACKAAAKDYANGDDEIAWNVYFTNSSYLDIEAETEPLFYNAMALMAYSYYESTIAVWAKAYGCGENLKAVREKLDITLSDKAKECQERYTMSFV